MFCMHCGASLEDGSRFCTSCGRSLDDAKTQVMPPANAPRNRYPQAGQGYTRPASSWEPVQQGQPVSGRYSYPGGAQEPSSRGPVIALVVAAALVAIAAVVVVFVIRPFDPVSTSTPSSAAASAQAGGKSAQASAAAPNVLPREEEDESAGTTTQKPSSASTRESSTPSAQKGGDYVIPDSASRYLSRSELQRMELFDLYLARNEIYARHGRGFKNQDLRDYFGKKSWYHERYTPDQFERLSPSPLNDYERKNADLMLEVETSRNSPYV